MEKYSDKFLNQTEKLKKAVIGFEFEFYMKDLSYYKTLELLNIELAPVKVWGFRTYHADFTPDNNNFKLERDLSGGVNMAELITGPLEYHAAKIYFIKIIKFIQKYGYTSDKSSIHFNISFNDTDKNLNDINILKLILNTNEDEIYNYFPTRRNNVYAKSVKNIIPFKDYDFHNIGINVVKNNLRLPEDKYYGINFLHITDDVKNQRLEYRYIGGKDYEKNLGNLLYFLDKFIITTYNCTDENFNTSDAEKLEQYLSTNINSYKNLSRYDNFIVDYPSILIQIDQNSLYDLVSAYYGNIYNELYNLIEGTDNLKDCIINYDTDRQTLEIVGGKVIGTSTLSGYDFIDSEIIGIFDNCNFSACDVDKSQLFNSIIDNSTLKDSKIINTKAELCELNNCFFDAGYLNSEMKGGVFKNGKLGPYAILDSNVNVLKHGDNFFNTKYEDDKSVFNKLKNK